MKHSYLKKQLTELSQALIAGSQIDLNKLLEVYDPQFDHHYYHLHITDENIAPVILQILNRAGISERQQKRFHDAPITVRDFLNELACLTEDKEDIHKKISKFGSLIDQKYYLDRLCIGGSIFLVGTLGISTLSKHFNWSDLLNIISTSLFFPVLGFVYTLIGSAYQLYQNIDKSQHFWRNFTENLFLLTSTSLNIVAYILIMSTATVFSPHISGLFITAACIDALKEIVTLIRFLREHKDKAQDTTSEHLQVRSSVEFSKHRNRLILDIGFSLMMVGIICCWNLMPAGLLLSIAAASAIVTLALLNKLLNFLNDRWAKLELYHGFDILEGQEGLKVDCIEDDKPQAGVLAKIGLFQTQPSEADEEEPLLASDDEGLLRNGQPA